MRALRRILAAVLLCACGGTLCAQSGEGPPDEAVLVEEGLQQIDLDLEAGAFADALRQTRALVRRHPVLRTDQRERVRAMLLRGWYEAAAADHPLARYLTGEVLRNRGNRVRLRYTDERGDLAPAGTPAGVRRHPLVWQDLLVVTLKGADDTQLPRVEILREDGSRFLLLASVSGKQRTTWNLSLEDGRSSRGRVPRTGEPFELELRIQRGAASVHWNGQPRFRLVSPGAFRGVVALSDGALQEIVLDGTSARVFEQAQAAGRPQESLASFVRRGEAVFRSVASQDRPLLALDRILARMVKGPPWKNTFDFQTARLDLRAAADQAALRALAVHIDAVLTALAQVLGPLGPARGPAEVLAFENPTGLRRYAGPLAPRDERACYVPAFRQLLVVAGTGEVAVSPDALRAELIHQHLERMLDRAPPAWLRAGLTDYLEAAGEPAAGGWQEGLVSLRQQATLQGDPPPSLRGLLAEDGTVRSSRSWAFIHFLRNSTMARRQLLERLLQAFAAGLSTTEAIDRALQGEGLGALEEEFRQHWTSLQH